MANAMKLPQPTQGFEGVCQRGLWQPHEHTIEQAAARVKSDTV